MQDRTPRKRFEDMTPEERAAFVADTPRRHREAMERISQSPQYRAALDRLIAKAEERANG